jgi:hypothetical protein
VASAAQPPVPPAINESRPGRAAESSLPLQFRTPHPAFRIPVPPNPSCTKLSQDSFRSCNSRLFDWLLDGRDESSQLEKILVKAGAISYI